MGVPGRIHTAAENMTVDHCDESIGIGKKPDVQINITSRVELENEISQIEKDSSSRFARHP